MKLTCVKPFSTAVMLAASLAATVHADVTVQQNTTLDVASLVKMHGSITSNITPNKRRENTEGHCEGLMSVVCGNVQSGEIVRLDRDLTWRLEPKKKRYTEQPFATQEELAAIRANMQARLDKLRSCPVSQKQAPVDKSKCEMSGPKFDIRRSDDKLAIAGHDAQRTTATITESCTNKETGEVCDTIVAVDLWLTQDTLPGFADRAAFDAAYAKKLGLADVAVIMKGEAAKFLAPYQDQIKQLTDKSADIKGQALKTSFRVLIGGKTCNSSSKAQSGGSSASPDLGNPLANAAQAGKALGGLVGGLFKKKKTDEPADAGPTAGAQDGKNSDPYAQYYAQLASFTVETVSVSTDPVPATQFEVPADWTKETPKAAKDDEEFTCPKT